ncbi:hypothetical protein LBMAG36_14150 [Chlorobiota bacterium]|nr:hypothetical protein LBMAG36_14150 [Chlorobiota bacterium]
MRASFFYCVLLSIIFLVYSDGFANDTLSLGKSYIYEYPSTSEDSLSWKISIANPTMLFIDSLSINDKPIIINNLYNDSIIFFTKEIGKVNVYISPLAGTDSITTMHIQIIQNRAIILDTVQQVFVKSLYTPLPYIRIAAVSDNIPNPVSIHQITTWFYRIDRPSDISIQILDILGRIIYKEKFFQAFSGQYQWSWEILPYIQSPGVYFFHIQTNSGEIVKKWSVSP